MYPNKCINPKWKPSKTISSALPFPLNPRHIFNCLLNIVTWIYSIAFSTSIVRTIDEPCSLNLLFLSFPISVNNTTLYSSVHGKKRCYFWFTQPTHLQFISKSCWVSLQNTHKAWPFLPILALNPSPSYPHILPRSSFNSSSFTHSCFLKSILHTVARVTF